MQRTTTIARRVRYSRRWIDVLVYCPMCERWIAHEQSHYCRLDREQRQRRELERTAKMRELLN